MKCRYCRKEKPEICFGTRLIKHTGATSTFKCCASCRKRKMLKQRNRFERVEGSKHKVGAWAPTPQEIVDLCAKAIRARAENEAKSRRGRGVTEHEYCTACGEIGGRCACLMPDGTPVPIEPRMIASEMLDVYREGRYRMRSARGVGR